MSSRTSPRTRLCVAAAHGLMLGAAACGGSAAPSQQRPVDATTVTIPEEPPEPETEAEEEEELPASEPRPVVVESDVQDCCKGMNECKGKGGCRTEDNDCAGKNDCKGKGGCKQHCPR